MSTASPASPDAASFKASPSVTTSTGSVTASPAISNTSAKLRLPPRVVSASAKERVNSILDEGRRRSLAMEGAVDRGGGGGARETDSSAGSPLGGAEGRISHRRRSAESTGRGGRVSEAESSADEETSIMQGRGENGQSTMNYQGTNQTQTQMQTQPPRTPVSRSRPTTASIRRTGRVYEQPREGQERNEEDGGQEHESWWAKLLSEYGSIELENKGSVARDHLALERTFLAWLRTSLAFASIGIAITQLFRLNTSAASGENSDPYNHLRQLGKPLGATFLGISIVMLFVGFHRYFESQHWIIRGKFPASRGSVALVALITLALMVTSLIVVLAVEPNAVEKT